MEWLKTTHSKSNGRLGYGLGIRFLVRRLTSI